jgi:flagellar basal body-associated protein FliL
MKVSTKTMSYMTIIYRFLLALFLLLVVVILGGTIYAFFLREEGRALTGSAALAPGEHIFTQIGRLRLPTADQGGANIPDAEPAMVIISVAFPYTPEDLAFSEELAARVRDFRTLTETYFGSIRADDLRNMGEEQIKADLLVRYNSVLRLGKIDLLYFLDYMLLE